MRKEKKPIRASVTAAIAAVGAAPSDFTKSKKPCTVCPTPQGAQCAPHPARFAQFKVSVRLIPDEKARWNDARWQCATKPACAASSQCGETDYWRYCWMRVVRSPA